MAHLVHLIIGTGALTGIDLSQSIITSETERSVAINLLTVLLCILTGPAALGPAIVLSKLYANSMMVLVNDRIPSGHGRDGRTMSGTGTVALGSLHFANVDGSEDTVQEQPAWEGGCDDERSSTLGQMVEDSSDRPTQLPA